MKKRITISMVVGIMLLGGGALSSVHQSVATEKQEMAVTQKNVRTQVVGDVDASGEFSVRGVVSGEQEVQLAPKVSGRVTRVHVDIGDSVYKGQLLATIDGSEMWAQTQVAHSGVAAAEEAVKETKEYFEDQVRLAKKARSLAEDGYEDAKAGGDAEKISEAKAHYELAKKSYDAAKSGRALQVDLARGQRDVAQSQLVAAQAVAANTQLRAPFSGVIAARHIEAGSLVAPTAPMFVIVQGAQKQVDLSVAVSDLQHISVGDTVRVLHEEGSEERGTVKVISPMIDTQTRKGLVRVTLAADTDFTLGEYVRVIFAKEDIHHEAVFINRRALTSLYHDMRVFVVRDGVVSVKTVVLGEDYGQQVEVISGLEQGDVVVVEGQQYLRDGDVVTVIQ